MHHPAAQPRKLMKEIIIPPLKEDKQVPKYVGRRTGKVFDTKMANGNEWLLNDNSNLGKEKNMLDLYESDDEDDDDSVDERYESIQRKLNHWDDDSNSDSDSECEEVEEDEDEIEYTVRDQVNKTKREEINDTNYKEMREKMMKDSNPIDLKEVENKFSEDNTSPNIKKVDKKSVPKRTEKKEASVLFSSNKNIAKVNITNNFLKSTNKNEKDLVKIEETIKNDNVSFFDADLENNHNNKDNFNLSFISNKHTENNVGKNNKNFPNTNLSTIKKKVDNELSNILTDDELLEDKDPVLNNIKINTNKPVEKVNLQNKVLKTNNIEAEVKNEKRENKILKTNNNIEVQVKNEKKENKVLKTNNNIEVQVKNEKKENKATLDKEHLKPKYKIKQKSSLPKPNNDDEEEFPLNTLNDEENDNRNNKNNNLKEKALKKEPKQKTNNKRLFDKAFPEGQKEEIQGIKRGNGGKKIVVSESQFIKESYQRMLDSQGTYRSIRGDEEKEYFGVTNRYSKRIRVPKLNTLAGERLSYTMDMDPILNINVPRLMGVFSVDNQLSTNFQNYCQISRPKKKKRLIKSLKNIEDIKAEIVIEEDEEDFPEDYEESGEDETDDQIIKILPHSQKGICKNLQVNLKAEVLEANGRNKIIIGKQSYLNAVQGKSFKIPPNTDFNFINFSTDNTLKIKLAMSN